MNNIQNLFLITFFLKRQKPDFEVRCCGCKEIIIPDYKKPVHVRGMIEFDGNYIPVIDPGIWFCGEPTQLTTSACILVVSCSYEYRKFETGILVRDTEEIMNLAAGSYKFADPRECPFNIRFILEISRNDAVNDFLADSHFKLSLCERQKRIDDDFSAFKEIASRGLSYA